jgi:dTDP-4-dehydrorhamnose 3,5-epimerase
MIFTETALSGAFVIDPERREDERGFFARVFCQREFAAHGLNTTVAQASVAFSHRRGIIRGMHFQYPPAAENKLVRCTRGTVLDVIVDLRPESPSYLQHVAVELSADNRRAVYVPERFAHGYQVLEDDSEMTYQMGEFYTPAMEGGIPYDDSRLVIAWPLPTGDVSEEDRNWPPIAQIEPDLRKRMAVSAVVGVVR